jgi:hypothetical protein
MKNMIKVYFSDKFTPLLNDNNYHFLPFDFEPENFEKCTDIDKCDIIPMLFTNDDKLIDIQQEYLKTNNYAGQLILILDIFHIDDYKTNILKNWKNFSNNVLTITKNFADRDHIHYDFMWNRAKAYYTDYQKFDLVNKVWSKSATQKMYSLAPIEKTDTALHFLCPNRIYYSSIQHSRIAARIELKNFLKKKIKKGYGLASDPQRGIILECEEFDNDFKNSLMSGDGGTWWPVANKIYNSTFASIYVETIINKKNAICITEKSYDPLIKGHFIIPFAYQGIIEDLSNRGFLFPSWIDYSYDKEKNYNLRKQLFFSSVSQYLNIPKDRLFTFYQKDKYILEKNREIFFSYPYDSLFEKIKSFL